jgi:hypothetical protein
MEVRSSDGSKLGRVLSCEEGRFIVEKGFFFATDYVALYDDVSAISADVMWLSRGQEENLDPPSYGEEGGGGLLWAAGSDIRVP